jgi:hypothetical protein
MSTEHTGSLPTLTPEMVDIDGRLLQRLKREIFHDDDSEYVDNPDDEISSRRIVLHVDVDSSVGLHVVEDAARSHLDGSSTLSGSYVKLTVPPQTVARLAFELLYDRFIGREGADKEFAEFCRSRQIVVSRDQL